LAPQAVIIYMWEIKIYDNAEVAQMTKRSKQGVQGAYNQATRVDLRNGRFERQWVGSMVQELRYNDREMGRWQRFAVRVTDK
jgi:hypothetical protein